MTQRSIKRVSLVEQLCDILKELIDNGTFKDGDKLPTEKELTERYNVSRLTVRAAIQRLSALGLVTSKTGAGTYVKAFNIENFLKEVSSRVIQPKMLDDVKDFRLLIDLECIRLAIQFATDEDLEKLKDACDDYSDKVINLKEPNEANFKNLAESDFMIHMTICELSKNSLYVLAYKAAQEPIKEFLYTIIEARYKRYFEQNSALTLFSTMKTHIDLYEAIQARDFKKAKKIFLNHVDYKVFAIPAEFL